MNEWPQDLYTAQQTFEMKQATATDIRALIREGGEVSTIHHRGCGGMVRCVVQGDTVFHVSLQCRRCTMEWPDDVAETCSAETLGWDFVVGAPLDPVYRIYFDVQQGCHMTRLCTPEEQAAYYKKEF